MSEGRWPANVILSTEMAKALDEQSGERKSSGIYEGDGSRRPGARATNWIDPNRPGTMYADSGGASRFFLEAGYEPEELAWIYSVGLRPYGTAEQ